MPKITDSPDSQVEVSVHLMDIATGRPVQSWVFVDCNRITLGRSPDQSVVLSDPYVSRNHVELLYQEESWVLISHGLHGVLTGGKLVSEMLVLNDIDFRMGSEGPWMRFCVTRVQDEVLATLNLPEATESLFSLDANRLNDEVTEIMAGEYFQSLKQQAKLLRSQRNYES